MFESSPHTQSWAVSSYTVGSGGWNKLTGFPGIWFSCLPSTRAEAELLSCHTIDSQLITKRQYRWPWSGRSCSPIRLKFNWDMAEWRKTDMSERVRDRKVRDRGMGGTGMTEEGREKEEVGGERWSSVLFPHQIVWLQKTQRREARLHKPHRLTRINKVFSLQ